MQCIPSADVLTPTAALILAEVFLADHIVDVCCGGDGSPEVQRKHPHTAVLSTMSECSTCGDLFCPQHSCDCALPSEDAELLRQLQAEA